MARRRNLQHAHGLGRCQWEFARILRQGSWLNQSVNQNQSASAAAATLLGLALVFLGGGLVVTQPLEVGEDPGFRHLPFEPTQGGLDPFVFADGDLGHTGVQNHKQLTKVAKALPLPLGSGRLGSAGARPGVVVNVDMPEGAAAKLTAL